MMVDIIGAFWEGKRLSQGGGPGKKKKFILLEIVLINSKMKTLVQLLGSKSHLIIGQKFEIMLDIISVFWEIWLDIVLNISFF